MIKAMDKPEKAECLVCDGKGEFEGHFTITAGIDWEHGPIEEEHSDTITCTDCGGEGVVEEDIRIEQTGERIGTPDDWRESMIDNHIEQIWGV